MIPKTAELYGERFRGLLMEWFVREGRSFPWRSLERAENREGSVSIHDPYEILVSEIMLQQTQASRVAARLPEFLMLFPSVEALASAGRDELLVAWRGMGYNQRALRLRETCIAVVRDHDGRFPDEPALLRALPGVGRYTSSAILCFAFGRDVPVIDVNIARLLSRVFHKCYVPAQVLQDADLIEMAARLVPAGDSYRYHQALMDLGAVVCTARKPLCVKCPVAEVCLSRGFPETDVLFDPASSRRPEPMFLGEPRRIWRGRIVESLRSEGEGLTGSSLMSMLLPEDLFRSTTVKQRTEFLAIVEGLIRDQLVERGIGAREGGLQEGDLFRLPRG